MGLFSNFKRYLVRRNDEKIINAAITPVNNDAIGKRGLSENLFKRIKNKGIEYNGTVSSRDIEFKTPEYDLNLIAAAFDIDSYLRRAVEKYVELILKNGFDFVGKNINTVKYIRKRFEQIATVTNIPTPQLFEDIATQLVTYSNSFISKVRDEKGSGGKTRTTFYGKDLKPVAGYFVEDATSMQIAKDIYGTILGYKQQISSVSETPIWRPEDMIHMYYSRKKGLTFGTPIAFPVIDDIKALRKIEQNVEILSHQHAIPIIKYTIGNEKRPGSIEEVRAVQSELENNPPYGCFVTTERHTVEAVDVKLNAQDMDKLVNIFKMRVYAGLGVSPLVMGEGASAGRQTAESLDRQMENTAEKFMKTIKLFVDEYMIKELLLEGGYTYDAYNIKNKVELYFPPINAEAKNKKEEHVNNMYQGNILTQEEVRVEIGRDPMTPEQQLDTHLHHIQIPLSIIKAVDETYTGPGHGTPSAKPGSSSQTNKVVKQAISPVNQVKKIQAKVANLAQPVNQHGKSLSRPRITKDIQLNNKIDSHYKATIEDVIMSAEDGTINKGLDRIINTTKNLINSNFYDYFILLYSDAYKSVRNNDIKDSEDIFNNNIRYLTLQESLEIDNIFNNIRDSIKKFIIVEKNNQVKNNALIQSIFNNHKSNLDNIVNFELLKAYNIGIIQASLDNKMNTFQINSEDCNIEDHINKDIIIDSIDYSKILPLTKSCNCYLSIKE